MKPFLEKVEKEISELISKRKVFLVRKVGEDLIFTQVKTISQKEKIANVRIMGSLLIDWMKRVIIRELPLGDFAILRSVVDHIYLYARGVIREKGGVSDEKQLLRTLMLAMKLGGKIPLEYLLSHESDLFRRFITKNHLHHKFFALRLQLPYEKDKGAFIPVETSKELFWIPFSFLSIEKKGKCHYYLGSRLVFETDEEGRLSSDYTCLFQGITKYHQGKDPSFVPYDLQDPSEWGHKYIFEVWTVAKLQGEDKSSMLRRTHAYFCLKNANGEVRSCGQDVLVVVQDASFRELFSRKPSTGRITTPDNYVYFPRAARVFWKAEIEITKEEHDKIIEIVERDKNNKEHLMSLLRGNCVSYVSKILKNVLSLPVDPSMYGVHIFAKQLFPGKIYRAIFKRFDPWYQKLPKKMQYALFFFPPFYLPTVIMGVIAYCLQKNTFEGVGEVLFSDIFLRPWRLSCEHPLQLQRQIERMVNKVNRKIIIFKKARN